MTPFEQGYEAFLKGKPEDANPYGKETNMYGDGDNQTPWSERRWREGWKAAQRNKKS